MWEHIPNCLHSFLSVKAMWTSFNELKRFAAITQTNVQSKPYLRICSAHWAGSQVCRSRRRRCRWPRSGPHRRLRTSSRCGYIPCALSLQQRTPRSHTHARQDEKVRRRNGVVQHTFLCAADFIWAVVLTVVEVVAEQIGVDAATIETLELILLTNRWERERCWKRTWIKKTDFYFFQHVLKTPSNQQGLN